MADEALTGRWRWWLMNATRQLTRLRRPPRALLRAAAPVLADVQRTRPEMVLRVEAADYRSRKLAAGMLWATDGTGAGISVSPRDSYAEQVATVAEQVQEIVQETSPWHGWSSAWPSCAEHPDSHPAELGLLAGHRCRPGGAE